MTRARWLGIRWWSVLASTAICMALMTSAARAQSVANDNYDNRTAIANNSDGTSAASNVFAGTEPNEPLTSNDPNQRRCGPNGSAGSSGARMINTTWWDFVGTGGVATVSTQKSNPAFDTVLAIYDTDGRAFLTCNDDIGAKGGDPAMTSSKATVQTIAGHHYAVQVGSCESTTTSPQSCASQHGSIVVSVSSPEPVVSLPPPDPQPTPPAPAGARKKLPARFTGYGGVADDARRTVVVRRFSVLRVPTGTTLRIGCSTTAGCPFGKALTRKIGPGKVSLSKLLSRRHGGRIAWGSTLTFTLTNPDYRGLRLKLAVTGKGNLRAGRVKTLA